MAKRKGVSEPKQKAVNGRVYWHCRISIGRKPDGALDRKDVYANSYDECIRKRNAMAADVDRGIFIDPARMTYKTWLIQWLSDFLSSLKDSTRTEYRAVIDRHIMPGLGARQISKLTLIDCQRFINKLQLSPGTVRNVYSVLRHSLEDARKAQLIPRNPAEDVTLPKNEPKEKHALSPEESQRFIEALKGHPSENLFIFMLETGIRVGEARGLRWTSVNFKQGEVRIIEQLSQKRGTDGKESFTAPKYNSKRTLYPTPAAMQALKDERALQRERIKRAGPFWTDEYGLVFTREDGTPIPYRTIAAQINTIGAAIGVDGLSAHSLRHTYATDCNDAGISPKTVAASLGHKHAQITIDRYTHDSKESQQNSSMKLHNQRKKRTS